MFSNSMNWIATLPGVVVWVVIDEVVGVVVWIVNDEVVGGWIVLCFETEIV